MWDNKILGVCMGVWTGWILAGVASAQPVVDASPPQGVTLSVYDEGFALVSESRRVVLEQGDQTVRLTRLPARLDVASVTHAAAGRSAEFDVLEKRYLYDFADPASLLDRFQGGAATVRADGRDETGLVRLVRDAGGGDWLFLERETGAAAFPVSGISAIEAQRTDVIRYPEPTLLWRTRVPQDGPKTFRVGYRTDGISWTAYYDVILSDNRVDLLAKVEVNNHSGGRFEDARLRLIMTERGLYRALNRAGEPRQDAPAQRYVFGMEQPVWEQAVAGLTPEAIFEVPRSVSLDDRERLFVQVASLTDVPVERFHVYDGVKFDRFQRNRRNDWNYGTEFHSTVETYLSFANEPRDGASQSLPPGWLRLFEAREDGAVDYLGETFMLPVQPGQQGNVRVGPSRGLTGERERIRYEEVRPLHEYEESFEIRLLNTSGEDAVVRVIEHLYRWPDFEIVKSDTEFEQTGPQTIEFRPEVKAGGRRSVHYTVRYSW